MKRCGGIWNDFTSLDNIMLAIYKSKRHKRRYRWVRRVEANPLFYADQIREMVINGSYVVSPYKQKTVFEPKQRTIYILPYYPDRIVQHMAVNVLEPVWDKWFISDSYACRKGFGQHKGVLRCSEFVRKYKYCLKCDISKFYPSIDHDVLKGILRLKLKDVRMLAFLDQIIDSANSCSPVGGKNTPIGNLLSSWFGNIYLTPFDFWVKRTLGVEAYMRYCDDTVYFSNDKGYLHEVQSAVSEYLAQNCLMRLSKASVFPVSQGVDFLGYRVFPDYLLARKRIVKKFKIAMRSLADDAKKNLRRAHGRLASLVGYFQWANTYNLRTRWGLNEQFDWIKREFAALL